MYLLIMGAPGSGKGTMSEKICVEYGIAHISTGDLLRQAVKSGSLIGQKAHEYMSQGLLVPDDIIHDIIVDYLKANPTKGFLMDGYPRTIEQAKDLDDICKSLNIKIDYVIVLDLLDEVIEKRITGRRVCKDCGTIYHIDTKPSKREGICDQCGGELYIRSDDTIESLRVRLIEYEKSTKPLINYYKDHIDVIHIDGDGTPEKVFEAIKGALSS